MKIRRTLAVVLLIAGGAPSRAEQGVPTVAFVGMTIINSSLEPTSDQEWTRLNRIESDLKSLLEKSGRYRFLSLPPGVATATAGHPDISGCNGCQIGWGREAGADLVMWGTVQKVSNLILNINVYLDDVKSGRKYLGTSVDIRGNTDESWSRGIRYLVENNLLRDWTDTDNAKPR